MQTQNIQRPALFSDFFGLELLWNNEYLTYIQTCIKNVTSTIHKTVNTSINNIKKSLKEVVYYRSIENQLIKECTYFKSNQSSSFIFIRSAVKSIIFIGPNYEQHLEYDELYESFSIFDPQPHNNALSLV